MTVEQHDNARSVKRSRGEKYVAPSGDAKTFARFAALAPSKEAQHTSATGRKKELGNGRQQKLSVAELMRQPAENAKKDERRPSKQSSVEPVRQTEEVLAVDDKKSGGRARDDVFSEIRDLLDTNSTLQLADFDYRIRQHLHALLGSGGRQKLHDALKAINLATSKKERRDVKNWPAYLRKLLTKFEEEIAWKDREARARARVEKAAEESATAGKSSDSKSSSSEELSEGDEEEAWLSVLNKELPADDQWLKDLSTTETKQHTPPPPPTEAPPPPPQEIARTQKLQGMPPAQPLVMPPAAPPQRAPIVPPAQNHTSSKQAPSTPPPAFPPCMKAQDVRRDSCLQGPCKPPTAPPAASPESYLKARSAQATSSSLLATQPQPLHLNFSLEQWSAWIHCRPQHIAAN